jgi:3',5'-cyclic AMP phosphodiesterase CpdA
MNIHFKYFFILIILSFVSLVAYSQSREKNLPPDYPQFNYNPSAQPDRILLTWTEDAHSSQTVTWRTDTTVQTAYAEIALAAPSPEFNEYESDYTAETITLKNEFSFANYHRVTFTDLQADQQYAYRVGSGKYWSEWIQFSTTSSEFKPFSFIYMGDAQNDLYSHWARAIRAAYHDAPEAKFIVHAGDLINHSQNDYEWGEWFEAGSIIHKTIPSIAVPGNHEYVKQEGKSKFLSPFWQPQFNFPKNGPEGLEDQCYYIDYQNCKIIALNSIEEFQKQASWLKKVLEENTKEWVFVTFHHPVISAAEGRVNKGVMENWKPILDKYKVDMVLQGHDHTYGRGQNIQSGMNAWDENSGTVYVVSVAGTKMYRLSDHEWMQRAAENTQLYQVIHIDEGKLVYEALTVDGRIYDAFELIKVKGQNNQLKELPVDIKTQRTFENTLIDPDEK